MRRLAIAMLGISLGFAMAAHAQADHATTYGTFAPNRSPPKSIGSGSFAPLPAPEPYHPHTAPSYSKPVGSTGSTDGGEGFKPYKPPELFKGTSVYGEPKPGTKPKSGPNF